MILRFFGDLEKGLEKEPGSIRLVEEHMDSEKSPGICGRYFCSTGNLIGELGRNARSSRYLTWMPFEPRPIP